MDDFMYGDLAGLDLKGKKVAIFGVGDQSGYGDNFCDAMDEIATCFEKQGAEIIGAVSADGYEHTDSKSLRGGNFVACRATRTTSPTCRRSAPRRGSRSSRARACRCE